MFHFLHHSFIHPFSVVYTSRDASMTVNASLVVIKTDSFPIVRCPDHFNSLKLTPLSTMMVVGVMKKYKKKRCSILFGCVNGYNPDFSLFIVHVSMFFADCYLDLKLFFQHQLPSSFQVFSSQAKVITVVEVVGKYVH